MLAARKSADNGGKNPFVSAPWQQIEDAPIDNN